MGGSVLSKVGAELPPKAREGFQAEYRMVAVRPGVFASACTDARCTADTARSNALLSRRTCTRRHARSCTHARSVCEEADVQSLHAA
eukprot:6175049-Pleurochrysis_carterae.AAC.2